MSRTLLTYVGTYVQPTLVKDIDAIRGDIPRSKIIERAIIRYLNAVKSGKVRLLPELDKIVVAEAATTK
jgi:hypothetical protein